MPMIHKIPDLRGEPPMIVFGVFLAGLGVVAFVALIAACCYFAGC